MAHKLASVKIRGQKFFCRKEKQEFSREMRQGA